MLATVDPANIIGYGSGLAFLGFASWLILQLMSRNDKLDDRADKVIATLTSDIATLKLENQDCRTENLTQALQIAGLLAFLVSSGLTVPEHLFRGKVLGPNL